MKTEKSKTPQKGDVKSIVALIDKFKFAQNSELSDPGKSWKEIYWEGMSKKYGFTAKDKSSPQSQE